LHLSRVEITSPGSASFRSLPPLSLPAIQTREQENIEDRVEEMETLGVGVSPEGQKLFDAIRRSTPCVWNGVSFIVLDTIRVSPPYTSSQCQLVAPKKGPNAATAAANEQMLNRVKKIIDAERAKLKLK
jgi:hypothetical protein